MSRRQRIAALLAPLVLWAGLALAGKPYVDYDRGFDFSKCQTFAWDEGGTPAGELNQKRIVSAVARGLGSVGLYEATTPDLKVVTHVNVERVVEPKAHIGFGIGGGTGWGGIGVETSAPVGTKTTDIGNLSIQLYDAATGSLVWEAIVSDTVDASPEDLERTINRAVDRAFKKYPIKPKK